MGWTDESDLTSRHPFKSTHAMRCFSTGTARQVRTTLAARTGDMQVCVSDRVSVCVYACQWPSFMRLIMCACVCVCVGFGDNVQNGFFSAMFTANTMSSAMEAIGISPPSGYTCTHINSNPISPKPIIHSSLLRAIANCMTRLVLSRTNTIDLISAQNPSLCVC